MNATLFEKLVEISQAKAEGREIGSLSNDAEVRDYLEMLDNLDSIEVPPPSTSKVWAGRTALLDAVQERPRRSFGAGLVSRSWQLSRASAAVLAATALATVASAAMVVTDNAPRAAMSEVLSALGIRDSAGGENQTSPRGTVGLTPVAGPESNLDAPAVTEPPVPTAAPPGGPVDSPSGISPTEPGHEDPGHGVEPPGLGGENPGHGVEPPGQGGEIPGQGNGNGVGQGATPPGQGGENPGSGGGNGDGVGQGGTPPGQGGEPPGQGGENPGQGAGDGQGHGVKP